MRINKLFTFRFIFHKKKKKKGKKVKNNFKIFLFSLAFLFSLPIAFYIFYQILFLDRIYPFVRVVSLDLSGKTEKEAEILLAEFIEKEKPTKLTLIFENKTWLLDLGNLKLDFLPSSTAKKAFLLGRAKSFLTSLEEQKLAFWQKVNLDFEFSIDSGLLSTQIASLAGQIDLPSIPPSIQILDLPEVKTGEKIIIKSGEPGRKLNRFKLEKTISQKLGQLESGEILLPVEQVLPEITDKMAQDTQGRAGKLLDKKIVLESPENFWEIKEKELINFLSFQGDFEEEKIATYTAALSQSIDRPAQNALFRFQEGRVLEFKPARKGQKLDQGKTKKLIIDALYGLEQEEKNKIAKVRLPINLSKPEIETGEVNNLGIKELIGEGQSWFYGSIPTRIYNIKLATSKLNGLLLAPGETFSLNNAVGDISEATGFKQAYIIEKGRTVLGDGGGVCQVSTTFFRAALNAGLPIEERHPHAYRVSYYEHNSQAGFDASIFAPTADFKFKNDTPAHILVQTSVNTAASKLTVSFYGTADGRAVFISKARVWDQVPPPPDLYQDDPTLPVGVVKQVDWKAWGAKAAFDWKVTRGEEVLQERTFYSTYRPWQAIFLRGTKE